MEQWATKALAATIRTPARAVLRRARRGGALEGALTLAGFDVERLRGRA